MRFDKWTLVSGAAALVLTVVLGALAGALAGVLSALADAAFGVFWQVASDRQSTTCGTGWRLTSGPGSGSPAWRAWSGGKRPWTLSARPSTSAGN